MGNKQTAVEWLIDKINHDNYIEAFAAHEWIKIFEYAKRMEKQQIIHAVEWDYKSNMGEVYYKATYGKTK